MIKKKYKIVEEDESEELEIIWDDMSGAELDPKAVRRARGEEIDYVRKMDLYNKVFIKQCYERICKGPISIRWIDINTGHSANPNLFTIRSQGD